MSRDEIIEGYKREYKESLLKNNGVIEKDNSNILSKIKNGSDYVLVEPSKEIMEYEDVGNISMEIVWENNKSYLLMTFGNISKINDKIVLRNKSDLEDVISQIKSYFEIKSNIKIKEKYYFGPVEWMGGVLPFYYTIIDENMIKKR